MNLFSETFNESSNASEDLRTLMNQFAEAYLQEDMDSDQPEIRRIISDELKELQDENWPLLKLAKTLCKWIGELEKKIQGVDE
jgi:hypothetical protein